MNETEVCQTLMEGELLIGRSEAIAHIRRLIRKVAPLDSTVLIVGETGTGKEVVARMIHQNSHVRNGRFVPVHAAGIPDTLLESALFGHEKGAYTGAYKSQKGFFELAENGTLFLDEIGELSMATQVKLLRVLQDGSYFRIGDSEERFSKARIIAATNRNLKKLVEQNKFREDLYYRINVITIEIPPLRERPEDIEPLARHFLRKYSQKHHHLGIYFKPEAIELLQAYHWPGNVRELENIIERVVALTDTDWIGAEELPLELHSTSPRWWPSCEQLIPYNEAKYHFEREYILDLLRRTHGNISKAARIAGMPRQNLHVKIKKYDIKTRPEEWSGQEENHWDT